MSRRLGAVLKDLSGTTFGATIHFAAVPRNRDRRRRYPGRIRVRRSRGPVWAFCVNLLEGGLHQRNQPATALSESAEPRAFSGSKGRNSISQKRPADRVRLSTL